MNVFDDSNIVSIRNFKKSDIIVCSILSNGMVLETESFKNDNTDIKLRIQLKKVCPVIELVETTSIEKKTIFDLNVFYLIRRNKSEWRKRFRKTGYALLPNEEEQKQTHVNWS